MKKIMSFITAAAMALSMCMMPVSAAEKKVSVAKVWSGKMDTSWFDGKKTSYDISTPEQLYGLSKLVYDGKHMGGITFNLTNDIVLNDTSDVENWETKPPKNNWRPIGDTGTPTKGYKPFAGIFNGNGHTISGMYANTSEYGSPSGLFGFTYGATIQNLRIDKGLVICNNKGKSYAGGIAGIAEKTLIENCENWANVIAYGPQPDDYLGDYNVCAGGIIGSSHTEILSKHLFYVGALAAGVVINPIYLQDGQKTLAYTYIRNCINQGYITAKTSSTPYAGGIAGYVNNGAMENCLNVGNIYSYDMLYGKKYNARYRGNIMGGMYLCKNSKCYYWNGKLDRGIDFIWGAGEKDNTAGMTKKKIIAKSFAEKLGKEFKYVKGNAPTIASLNDYSVNVVISSKKVNLSWDAVKDATSYKISYLKSNGKYAVLTTTKDTTAVLKELKSGKKYTILIQAKFKDGTTKKIKDGKFTFTA